MENAKKERTNLIAAHEVALRQQKQALESQIDAEKNSHRREKEELNSRISELEAASEQAKLELTSLQTEFSHLQSEHNKSLAAWLDQRTQMETAFAETSAKHHGQFPT